MGLTTITGNFPTLANNGRVVALALQSITDGVNIYPKGTVIATATIGSAGAFSIQVPDTQNTGIRIQFRIEQGAADPRTLVDVIERVIPTTTPTTLASLIDSYYSPTLLDASNWAIAQLLAANSAFLAAVPGFNELTWTAAQNFKLGDYTWRGDGLYRWISPTQGNNKDPLVAANVTPSVGAVWEKKATLPIGAAGSTNVRVYDQTIFEALTEEPASRKNLNELRSAIAAPDLSAYAQLGVQQNWSGKQNFGAGASALTATPGTSNTDVATNAFVQAAIAAIVGSGIDAAIVEERQPQGTDAGSSVAGINNRGLEFVQGNVSNFLSVAKPTVTLTKAGTYLIYAQAPSVAAVRHKLSLHRLNNTAARLKNGGAGRGYVPVNQLSDHGNDWVNLFCVYQTSNTNDQLQLRHYCEAATGTFGLGRAANEAAQVEVYSQMFILRIG